MEKWRARFRDAVKQGFIIINSKGDKIELDAKNGINILGMLVEASEMALNREYYGNLNSMAHLALAFIHDPEEKFISCVFLYHFLSY